jgi:hypothetical protein
MTCPFALLSVLHHAANVNGSDTAGAPLVAKNSVEASSNNLAIQTTSF